MKAGDLVFLGVCERAAYVQDGNTNLEKWNIIGLKNIVLSHIFPLTLTGWQLGFAISAELVGKQTGIEFIDESEEVLGTINISMQAVTPDAEDLALKRDAPPVRTAAPGHTVCFVSADSIGMMIGKPGVYSFRVQTDDGLKVIGGLQFIVVEPPPLTQERITAIRSEPDAAKAIRMELGCMHCPKKFRVYAALDRDKQMEEEEWQWYENIPDEFICECKRTTVDLTILRRNLHGLLGSQLRDEQNLAFIPLYEQSSLRTIRSKFKRLLDVAPEEEILQVFIHENPILLHQFPSKLIYAKPPILTSYKADFGIVTPQKELILIELEKTTTRLMTKKGGVAAPLNHAFDQVRDWLHVIDEHRLATLEAMKIDRNDVSIVRGVVIAGRDSGYDAQQLRKLKGSDWGNIRFLTYDDILFSLDALIRRLDAM